MIKFFRIIRVNLREGRRVYLTKVILHANILTNTMRASRRCLSLHIKKVIDYRLIFLKRSK
jgi:hypothetical protein